MWRESEKQILIPAVLILLAITIVLYFLLRNKSEKVKLIPFQVVSGILIVLEIIKQIVALTAEGGYDFWRLPVHFCSLILFFTIIASFGKGKVQRYGKCLSIVATMFLTIIFAASPNIVIGPACNDVFATFYSFQTIVFHLLGVFWLMLSVAFYNYKPKHKDLIGLVITYALHFCLMIGCSYAFDMNYGGVVTTSDIGLLETLRASVGQVNYLLIVTFGALCIAVLLFYIYYLFIYIRDKICHKTKS